MFKIEILAIHRLRVNIKSLAEEAKIIRKESKRCGSEYVNILTEHRRCRLREESRLAQLALAFVRKRSYRSVENIGSKSIHPKKISDKLSRFNVPHSLTDIQNWLNS